LFTSYVVSDLYRRRWRIEEAFNTGLAVAGFELFMDGFNQWCEIPCLNGYVYAVAR